MSETEKKSKSGIYITIIVLQILIIGWLIFNKVTTQGKTEVLITQLEFSKTEKDSLTQELETLLESYNELQTNNDTLNAKLSAEQKKIEELIEQIKNTKSSNSYLINQYKQEAETLRGIMRSYIKQIDSLYTKNELLVAENVKIKDDYKSVIVEKESLIEEKDSLKSQVAIASVLKAQDMYFIALNQRDKETTRTNKTEKFQICFNLSENALTKQGTKYVYIRITKPSGEVLRNSYSGFFTFGGTEIAYSAMKQVNYDGKLQNACIYYVNAEELTEGEYNVFIFVDGNQIGNYSIELN
jgi:hypothetical protein